MDKEDVVCVCVRVCIYIYIYISPFGDRKRNEILPFAAMWMELQDIMLREISQRKIS